MPSLIPGFEYDIFISYRQKDNKGDGWVSEFVESLKTELEATFKEDIGVYFDINPHDGLLETHDVDASLKDKLNCLILIPIISRTYCDPKSFAWEHEFKAFVDKASGDRFGLKVKLPNGNVASRVLPIRIHDLDREDIKLCETMLDGALRGVEFIYKEPGFNRPLKPDDNEKVNLNKTKYRNQSAKVALAIKDIIEGLKAQSSEKGDIGVQSNYNSKGVNKEQKIASKTVPVKLKNTKLLSGVAILSILIIVIMLAYSKIIRKDSFDKLASSDEPVTLAVLPFQNMTNDTIWNIWQDAIQNELINNLTEYEGLKVRQSQSITELLRRQGITNYSSFTPSFAEVVSKKLDAKLLIFGSIKQAGSVLRINAYIINSKTDEVFKSFNTEGPAIEENIFQIIDTLSTQIENFLIISELKKQSNPMVQSIVSTNSPEAYRYYNYGVKAFLKSDFSTAVNWYSHAIDIDSNFIAAVLDLTLTYQNIGMTKQAREWGLKLYRKRDNLPLYWKLNVDWINSTLFETPYESLKYLKQIQDLDDQFNEHYKLGITYLSIFQYDKAILELEQSKKIYNKWNDLVVLDYTTLGLAYHKAGQFKKERRLYREAEKLFPDDPQLLYRQAVVMLAEGDSILADGCIDKYISIRKEQAEPEINIISSLGSMYAEAGTPHKAEKYFREAFSMQQDNPDILNGLAWFLIDEDRNVKEGLELIEKAIALNPLDYHYYNTKGWGLFKQGKYKEALSFLENSWELKPIYDHQLYLHIEEVKKAINDQKEQ